MTDFDQTIQQAKKLAGTPEGQQLARMLQQLGGTGLQQALDAAAAGNPAPAADALSVLMKDPRARALLQQLGGSNGK